METLFENQFTLTQEDAKEITKVGTQGYRRFSLMMICLFCLISVYYLATWGLDGYMIKTSVVVLVCLFIIRAQVLRKQTTNFYRQQLVLHNHNPIVKTTTMFDECMEVYSSNGAKLTVHYEQITFVKKTAHFMMIFYEKAVIVPVKQSEFSKGTPEEFESFLLKKGVKVK
ncbi:MAG: YcxB family protein [Turicibacter sp.]|nr:YcxB family protein [Turicibacter sp.]